MGKRTTCLLSVVTFIDKNWLHEVVRLLYIEEPHSVVQRRTSCIRNIHHSTAATFVLTEESASIAAEDEDAAGNLP